MRTIAAGAVLVVVLLALVPGSAHAQGCLSGQFAQADIAGVYENVAAPMTVAVSPCGAVLIRWANASGWHDASYRTQHRMPDGGLIARVTNPDPWVGPLDGQMGLGLKPAEPGFLQMMTANQAEDWVRIYRLKKIT